jgi:DNA-binding NarL/FixJ family response regulator
VPDVTRFDLKLPSMNDIDVLQTLRHSHPDPTIVVLTTYLAGAHAPPSRPAPGLCVKAALRTDSQDTICAANAGEQRLPVEVASELAQHAADESLYGTGIEVLRPRRCWLL